MKERYSTFYTEREEQKYRALLTEDARPEGERSLAVRQGFEPWIQVLARITV